MLVDNYLELYQWDRSRLQEAAIKIVTLTGNRFRGYGTEKWPILAVGQLSPVIRGEVKPAPVVFQGDRIQLVFVPPLLDDEQFRETHPRFLFRRQTAQLSPRYLTQVWRGIDEVGQEAEEVLGAVYQHRPTVITLPVEQFGAVIHRGPVTMLDEVLPSYDQFENKKAVRQAEDFFRSLGAQFLD